MTQLLGEKNIPNVYLAGYRINQITKGMPHETAVSEIVVSFDMISDDLHLNKHEDFMNDVRKFLEERNTELRKSHHTFSDASSDLPND